MPARVHQFPCLSDNYGVLLHDPALRRTAAIDAPEAGPILLALDGQGWDLTDILITHHHGDHTGGIAGLRERFPRARLVGPAKEEAKIGKLDVALGQDDFVMVGDLKARVIETPGHTSGHITYHFAEEDLLFAGDTLFALGCGRPFEEPPAVLYRSLMKLARLPGSVQVYCGHEYTVGNARFAVTVDPHNTLLRERVAEVTALRDRGAPTLPTTIALECATNPFLRADEPAIKAALGMTGADAVDVFAALRERKNRS
jgi:hydroxyacylglutathione hydrolase